MGPAPRRNLQAEVKDFKAKGNDLADQAASAKLRLEETHQVSRARCDRSESKLPEQTHQMGWTSLIDIGIGVSRTGAPGRMTMTKILARGSGVTP